MFLTGGGLWTLEESVQMDAREFVKRCKHIDRIRLCVLSQNSGISPRVTKIVASAVLITDGSRDLRAI